MVLEKNTLVAVLDMLEREDMAGIVDETGVHIEFLWGTDRFTTFLPYGYDVTVNGDGYPEIAAGPITDEGWG